MQTIGAVLVKLLNILYIMVHTDAFSCPIGKNFILGSDGTCCKPIQCLENQGYRLCSNTGSLGNDTCYDCPPGTSNRERPVNTANIRFVVEFCTKIDCNCFPEAELLNREECEKTGNKTCVCKRWDGYYGNDPGACKGPIDDEIKLKKIRQAGYELKITGEVDKCGLGFFKNKSDNSICIPYTQCPNGYLAVFNGSTTRDRECQKITTTTQPVTTMLPVTTKVPSTTIQQPVTTSKTVIMLTTSTPAGKRVIMMKPNVSIIAENTTPDPNFVKNESERDSKNFTWVALGFVFGFGILIVLICICCHRKRKKKREKLYRSQQNRDIELKKFDKSAVSSPDFDSTTDDKETVKMSEKEPFISVIDETVHKEIHVDSNESDQGPNGQIKKLTEELSNSSKTVISLITEDAINETMTGEGLIQGNEIPQQSNVEREVSHNAADLNTVVKEQDVQVFEHKFPKVEKIMVEKQNSDPTNIRKKAEPCSRQSDMISTENSSSIFLAPGSSPLTFVSEHQPSHSYGSSLMTDEKYQKLSLSSFGEDHRVQVDSDYGTEVVSLEPGKRGNLRSENTEPENSKPCYEILERFKQKYAKLNIRRLYFGSYQNENKIVIAVVFDCDAQAVMNADVQSFENHDVVSKRLKEVVAESIKVENSEEAREWQFDHETAEKIEKEISDKSRGLMETHSNLEIISGSCIKSQKSGTHLLHKPCIVLYCSIKGIIPLKEIPFPTNIGDFPVDVREGFFFLSPNGNTLYQDSAVYDNLRMGCNIGTEGGMNTGTLGGFVALENGDIGFITCAHVLHEKLPIPEEKVNSSFRVVQPGYGKSIVNNICGEHVRSVCPFSKGPNAATVDAALVKVSPHRRPKNGLFAELTPEHVCKRGFDIDKPPTFHTGEIRDLRCPMQKEHRFQSCFKVGSQTGFTKGSLHLNCSAVRLVSATLKRQPVSCSVYKLFEIKPESDHCFATQGDSGALVFQAVTGTSSDRFVCIGMIIGIGDNNFCYVMPIKEVLKEFHLPHTESLYYFDVPMEIDNAG